MSVVDKSYFVGCGVVSKRALVEHGVVDEYSKASFAYFRGNSSPLEDFVDCYGVVLSNACDDVLRARYGRVARCRLKVGDLVFNGKAFFVTLTFSDKAMSRTTAESRRRAVVKFLKKVSKGGKFVANIDFGGENGREHYHAICEIVDFDTARKYWNKWYGGIRIVRVRSSDQDLKRTIKYINKLTAHAFKDSVHMNRVIYSRRSRLAPVADDVDDVDDALVIPLCSPAP